MPLSIAGSRKSKQQRAFQFTGVHSPVSAVDLAGYVVAARWSSPKVAKLWLTLASYAFYAYWHVGYLFLLLASVGVNYLLGSRITRAPRGGKQARLLLILGIAANLVLLGYYKYTGFLVSTANALGGLDFVIPNIILPLGISFYTFTQVAYLVDAYREDLSHYDFLTYNLFITFFPQLIAGPLLLHTELMPQLRDGHIEQPAANNMALGLTWFGIGLAKKVLLADSVSAPVADVFSAATTVNFLDSWVGVLSYTLQLYFDFSGYSDMAIGLSLMFNLRLPMNFDSPYRATSIVDFWRRWHMTLSRFLRDYLYISLGGNRHGSRRRFLNLMLTMVLGGLWHGAGWTFVIWGILHGVYLVVNHAWRRVGVSLPMPLNWLITMLCVVVGWVFFRAPDVTSAGHLLFAMFGGRGVELVGELTTQGHLLRMATLFVLAVAAPNTQTLVAHIRHWKVWALAGGTLTSLAILGTRGHSEFLYFQF